MRLAHKNTAPHCGALTNHKRVQGEVASGIQMANQRRVVYARARSDLSDKIEALVPIGNHISTYFNEKNNNKVCCRQRVKTKSTPQNYSKTTQGKKKDLRLYTNLSG